ncbi:MAG: amidohydrolase [Desulfobacteraceae bacterium]|nr:MAG: amidohydrolase [Desulfobacteraceae bacterium]
MVYSVIFQIGERIKREGETVSALILYNANIITMDPAVPRARSVSIQDGKISALSNESIVNLKIRNATVIDCRGKTILPGFIDAHMHLLGFAESLVTVNLEPRNNIRSISDIQAKILKIAHRLTPGTWIRGSGYNEFYLEENRHPNRWDLDSITTAHPIKLSHRSGGAYVLNSLGLKLVGISKETGDPPGALIDRDLHTREPTGLLFGMGDYLGKSIPHLDSYQMALGIKRAGMKLCASGITSIHDASPGNDLDRWELIQGWKNGGLLKTRVRFMLGKEGFEQYRSHSIPARDDESQITVGGVKLIVHEITGRISPDQTELDEMVLNIHSSNLQAVLHAVEARTIKVACRAVAHALQKSPRPNPRHRIEHCSVCAPSLAKEIASLGITVVTQPSFIFFNGDRYLRTVPNSDLRHLYPIRTLVENRVVVAAGSDCPIAPPNPLIGIRSAVSRKTEKGLSILPEEGIPAMEAVKMFTLHAARAGFEEKIKGSVTPGKLADLAVLNGDPTESPADEIKDIEVEMTILNGEVVWDKTA